MCIVIVVSTDSAKREVYWMAPNYDKQHASRGIVPVPGRIV
jgi:hypothetical protein